MLQARGAEVSEDLSGMLIDQRLAGLEFDDQLALDEKVGVILAKDRSVLVADRKRVLLVDADTFLSQAVSQSVLVHLLQMSVPQIPVQGKTDLANPIAEAQNLAIVHSQILLRLFRFCNRLPFLCLVPKPLAFSLTLCPLCLLWL